VPQSVLGGCARRLRVLHCFKATTATSSDLSTLCELSKKTLNDLFYRKHYRARARNKLGYMLSYSIDILYIYVLYNIYTKI
jgi:hypothetical protein